MKGDTRMAAMSQVFKEIRSDGSKSSKTPEGIPRK